ncbi:hypothetical protein QTP88_017306 [Uroleucon formosanum]
MINYSQRKCEEMPLCSVWRRRFQKISNDFTHRTDKKGVAYGLRNLQRIIYDADLERTKDT